MTTLRDAVPADANALGALHVRTWRESYWGVLPDESVLRETPEGRARFWRTHLNLLRLSPTHRDESVTVARDGRGGLLGFAWAGAARGGRGDWDGEIYMLYVLHAAQRQGVGRLLLEGAARRLVRRGFFRLGLWVLEDNGPARAFYEALGGRETGTRRQQGASGAEVVAGYVWEDVGALLGETPAKKR
jgi:ribosomal protein S18 acetylase RimI-like enzyme